MYFPIIKLHKLVKRFAFQRPTELFRGFKVLFSNGLRQRAKGKFGSVKACTLVGNELARSGSVGCR